MPEIHFEVTGYSCKYMFIVHSVTDTLTCLNKASYLFFPHPRNPHTLLRVHFIILQSQDDSKETALINITLVNGIVILM